MRVIAKKRNNINSMHSMLGRFEYCDNKHGWAVQTGYALASYRILSEKRAERDPLCSQGRQRVVEIINQNLNEHNIHIKVPDIISGMKPDIIHDYTSEILYVLAQIHPILETAVVIGIAASHLEMHKALGIKEYLDVARNILNLSSGLGVNTKLLVDAMLVTDCQQQSVRTLLRSLHAVQSR